MTAGSLRFEDHQARSTVALVIPYTHLQSASGFMIRYIGLTILYLLLGTSIGIFDQFAYQPFIDKLFPREKIRNIRVHTFADLVIAILSAIGTVIIAIPFAYLMITAKNLPLNLIFLNLICGLALFIGYGIAIDLKRDFDIRRTFTSTA
ncbi:MAG TPA: hypothetical protein VKG02_24665, partial [Blastocatellia bacterium]|nr:hypothetical protein [Blastocatellia bacterium]